jgi:DNA-binding NarL/FixJ family response regulator
MRVFIIDDYLDFARPLKDNFRFKRHIADYCIDSTNAVQNALAFQPDWVIIDLRMPYQSGMEVFKELKNKADFEFSAVFYSNYLEDPELREELNKLQIQEKAMIVKTVDIDRDVSEKLIPALQAGYLKGGKKNGS